MTKPVVLAVDDTPSNLDLLREILSEDYTVRVATNGEKALQLACRQPLPEIILLDIMMPGMSGYEVCQELKQDPETTPIPVIFVTAMAQVEDEQRGLALGAVDYITKPYDPEIVKARVKKEIANYQRTRELVRENRELRAVGTRTYSGEAKIESKIASRFAHAVESAYSVISTTSQRRAESGGATSAR